EVSVVGPPRDLAEHPALMLAPEGGAGLQVGPRAGLEGRPDFARALRRDPSEQPDHAQPVLVARVAYVGVRRVDAHEEGDEVGFVLARETALVGLLVSH